MSYSSRYQALDSASDLQAQAGKTSDAACQATGYSSIASFLHHIDSYGVQVQNNFEVELGGIQGIKFFVQSINLPGSKQNTCEVYYDGTAITIPVNFEADHDFSMTIVNDAKGFIYSVVRSYIAFSSFDRSTDPGNKKNMVVKALTGQAKIGSEQPYPGAKMTCRGVRLTSIGGLNFSQDGNSVQTFDVQGKLISYKYEPMELEKQSAAESSQFWSNRSEQDDSVKKAKLATFKKAANMASNNGQAAFGS